MAAIGPGLVCDRSVVWMPNAFRWNAGSDEHVNYSSVVDTAGLRFLMCTLNWSAGYPTGGASIFADQVPESGLSVNSSRLIPAATSGSVGVVDADGTVHPDDTIYNGGLIVVYERLPRFVAVGIVAGDFSSGSRRVIGTWYGSP